jgi:hypothetical protein
MLRMLDEGAERKGMHDLRLIREHTGRADQVAEGMSVKKEFVELIG